MPKARIENHIRRLRFEHGQMTQQDLADRVGCSRQTIIVLEQGRYVPSLSLAFAIARVFSEPIEGVFQYNGPDRGPLPVSPSDQASLSSES